MLGETLGGSRERSRRIVPVLRHGEGEEDRLPGAALVGLFWASIGTALMAAIFIAGALYGPWLLSGWLS